MMARPEVDVRLRAVVTLTKGRFSATHLRVVRGVSNLINWRNFNDFNEVEFVLWVLFAAHDENIFEALVIVSTVQCLTVAHAVEFKAFQSFGNRTWCEGTSTLNSIRIQKRLHVCCVRRL